MSRLKQIFAIVTMVVSLAVIAMDITFAWYVANSKTEVNEGMIVAAEQQLLELDLPYDESLMPRYSGQTGTQYNGVDSPFIVTYDNVTLDVPAYEQNSAGYFKLSINSLRILFAGLDENGNRIEKTYTPGEVMPDDEINLLEYFTLRLKIISATHKDENGMTVTEDENEFYLVENGYVVSEASTSVTIGDSEYSVRSPLRLNPNYQYNMRIDVIFQSEENYFTLLNTQADLPDDKATPVSAIRYQYSHFFFRASFAIGNLLTVNFMPQGGNCDVASAETTGRNVVDCPVPTYAENRKSFTGWYYEPACTNRFYVDSLLANPISEDINLYAGWVDNPKIEYYVDGTLARTDFVERGKEVTPYAPTKDRYEFLGWSTMENDETHIVDISMGITESIKLYAIWQTAYKVTLDVEATLSRRLIITKYVNGKIDDTFTTSADGTTYVIHVAEGKSLSDYFTEKEQGVYYKTSLPDGASYTFKHWATTAAGPIAYDTSKAIMSDTKLYAVFTVS